MLQDHVNYAEDQTSGHLLPLLIHNLVMRACRFSEEKMHRSIWPAKLQSRGSEMWPCLLRTISTASELEQGQRHEDGNALAFFHLKLEECLELSKALSSGLPAAPHAVGCSAGAEGQHPHHTPRICRICI
jgi:hypothetical protein